MHKSLISKFFILLLVVGLLFAVAPTRQAQAAAVVNNETELRTALAGSETTIELGASFALVARVDVNRSVTIDGKGFTITGPTANVTNNHAINVAANNVTIQNLTITGTSYGHNLQFYSVTGGVVTNVTLSNGGKSGMTVNGSQVTISGVTTTNNLWGGINVDQGGGVTAIPLLTVNDVTTHTSPTGRITAAIWVDKGNVDWVSASDLYTILPGTPLLFYNNAEFAAATVFNVRTGIMYSTIQAAIDATMTLAGDVIYVPTGTYNENLTVNKALTLQGAGDDMVTVNGVAPTTDAGMVNIVASNVTIDGFKFVGAGLKTIRLNAPSTNVTFSNNTVIGATYDGVGAWDLFTSNYNNAHSNLTITGNVFENHGGQIGVYLNPQITGLTFTNNTFQGDPTSGPVLGIDGMAGTEVITDNIFNIESPYGLFEGFGTVPIVDIFNANTWPAGYIASGKMVVPASVVYPSTNDINRTNTWGHVDFVSADVAERTITLEFFPNATLASTWVSCFERRTDGDTSQKIATNGGNNWNPEILDGLYPYSCYNAQGASVLRTISVIDYVEIRLSFGPEKDERFYWTKFELIDEVWVDDDFTSATPGWGVDHFAVIQDGVDAVATNGIVHVAAGTYAEDLEIEKPLTLLGPNAGVSGTGTRTDEAIVRFDGASWAGLYVAYETPGVTIDGFTFDGVNLVAGAGSYTVGVASDSSDFTLQNNIFINHKDIAIMTSGVYTLDDGATWLYDKWLTDVLIKDNKITNAMPNTSGYSFGIYYQSSVGTVSGNFITDVGSGIQVQPYWNTPVGGTIVGNTFQAYARPVYFNYTQNDGADWLFQRNIITGIPIPDGVDPMPFKAISVRTMSKGNVVFDKNQVTFGSATNTDKFLYFEEAVTGGTQSATPNWWGSVTGPAAGTFVGEADYLPYCVDPDCTTFSQAALSMTPATADLACGGTNYVVEVMVKDVVDLQSYELKLQFDHTRIQIISVENGGFLAAPGTASPGNDLGNDDGLMTWGWAPTGERKIDGSGSLIKITFRPTNIAGTSAFTILPTSALEDWPNSFSIPFNVTGGATVTTGSIVTNTKSTVETTDDISYCDLAFAVAQAAGGDTLRADVDITTVNSITVDKPLTLDTNGKTITRTGAILIGNNFFVVNPGGNLTINGGGTITTTKHTAIRVQGDASTLAKVTLEDATLYGPWFSVAIMGNTTATYQDTAYKSLFVMTGGHTNETVMVQGNGAEAEITGGTLTGATPIMGNGTASSGGTKITVGGTAVVGSPTLGWAAIYHPQVGELNINGGTIQGNNGIEMEAGDLVVTGGTIEGYGACVEPVWTAADGSTNTGDAILILHQDDYGVGDAMNVTISGEPTIKSTNCYALREVTLTGGVAPIETSTLNLAAISGGHFTGVPSAVSFTTVSDANLDLTAGDYSHDPIAYVYPDYGTSLHSDNRWYISLLPVLSSTTFDDQVTLGVATTFDLTVNPSVPGAFSMVFTGYPSETQITYDGLTYYCVGSPCVITVPVTLTGAAQTLPFAITVATAGTETPLASYAVTATLHAPAPAYGTTGRDLAALNAAVPVTPGFTVSGTVTMQGRMTRAGVPVYLTWNNTLGVTYGPHMDTDEQAVNFRLAVNYGGTYTITTLQPRYLNITADLLKQVTLTGNYTFANPLWLRAGNAIWQPTAGVYNNEINIADATKVLGTWATTGGTDALENSGDVNFDGNVTIKDLTLVGGNMDLTSTTAYGTWMP